MIKVKVGGGGQQGAGCGVPGGPQRIQGPPPSTCATQQEALRQARHTLSGIGSWSPSSTLTHTHTYKLRDTLTLIQITHDPIPYI